jgi:hypothetical protein
MSELIKCIRKSDGKEVFLPKKLTNNHKLMNEYGYFIVTNEEIKKPRVEAELNEVDKMEELIEEAKKSIKKTTKK